MALPILLVEDDLSLAQTVTILLESLGVPVEHCATGEVAIELVRSKRYPVVIADIILQSGISGLYVRISAARHRRPDGVAGVSRAPGSRISDLGSRISDLGSWISRSHLRSEI